MKSFPTLYVLLSWTIFTSMQAKQLKRPYTSDPKTFIELVNFVQKAPLWDTTNGMISEQSINTLKKGVQAASLDPYQINVIIDMTSSRIPFTGNAEQDKNLAQKYIRQKENFLFVTAQEKEEETSQRDQNEMTQYIAELIQKYADNLKNVFIDQEILYQLDTPDTVGPIIKELKEKYSTSEEQKAVKPILINKLKETLTGISNMRWDKIEEFLDLNLP